MAIKRTEGPNRGKTLPALHEMKDASSPRVCCDLPGTECPKEFKAPKGAPLHLVGHRRAQE